MIVTETYTSNNRDFIRRYSDGGFLIQCDQTGETYSEAVDLVATDRTYSETDTVAEDETLTDTEALNIILGVTV